MYKEDKKLLQEFQKSRNLTKQTINGYNTTIRLYTKTQGKSFKKLLKEADTEEINGTRWKERKLKQRLINFRTYLIEQDYYEKTLKEYMNRIKTLYRHHEIEIHPLPPLSDKNIKRPAQVLYTDLPDKQQIQKILEISTTLQKALILFMCSSGCAKKETLNLTIQDFIEATKDYHNSEDIFEVIQKLHDREEIIPQFQIHRQKTNKYYITFCSPEATHAIINYLIDRKDTLKPEKKLFKINEKYISDQFGEINRKLSLGNVGKYRKFRTHMLRKWHASMLKNDGMSMDDVNDLQGKSKGVTDQSYFYENPKKLKAKYIQHLDAITINLDVNNLDLKSPEYVKMEIDLQEKTDEVSTLNERVCTIEKILGDLGIGDIVDKVKKE